MCPGLYPTSRKTALHEASVGTLIELLFYHSFFLFFIL